MSDCLIYICSRYTRKIQKSIRVFFRHGSWIDGFDMIWWARWTFTDIEKAIHSNQKHQRDVRIFISPTSGISYTEFLAACLEDTHSSWNRAFIFLFFLLGQLLKMITRYSFTRLFMLKAPEVRIHAAVCHRRDTTPRKQRFGMPSGSIAKLNTRGKRVPNV